MIKAAVFICEIYSKISVYCDEILSWQYINCQKSLYKRTCNQCIIALNNMKENPYGCHFIADLTEHLRQNGSLHGFWWLIGVIGPRTRDVVSHWWLDPGRGGFKTGVRNLRSLLEQNVTHVIVAFRTRIEMDSSTVISIVCFSQ